MNPELKVILGYDVDQSTINKVNASFEEMGKRMQKIGTAMTLAVTAPLAALAASSIKSAAKIETLKTSLTTALGGSAAAAKSAFAQIEGFASSTPFAISEVTTAFIKLKNMGLDPSMGALESYGNTASSMGKSLNDMIEAVADAAVGEFERLKEFGIKAKSEGDNVSFTFKGVTTTVKKESQAIEGYLQNIGNTEFAGGIEAQSETYNGVMSTLKDNLELVSASFGDLMLPALKSFSLGLQEGLKVLRNLTPEAKKLILVVAGIAAAIGPLAIGLGTVIRLLPLLRGGLASMKSMMLAVISPVGLVVAGIIALTVALAAAFIYVRDNLQVFKEEFANIWINIKNGFIDILKSMIKPWTKFADLLGLDIGENTLSWLDSFKEKTKAVTTEWGSFGRAFKNAMKDVGLISDSPIADVNGGDTATTDPTTPTGGSGNGTAIDLKDKTNFGVIDLISKQGTIDKFKTTLGETLEGVTKVYSERMMNIAADWDMINATIKDSVFMGIAAIGEVFPLAFASIFNKNIDFKKGFKQLLGRFLSGLGDMVMAMAIKLKAVAALKTTIEASLATVGGGAIGLAAAAGLFALGAAMKGGGMALSNASGVSGSNSSFQGGGSSGSYGTQPIRVTFENGALQGYMNAQTQRRGR